MMIEKMKKIFWKVEGMDFSDNSSETKSVFHLKYRNILIGVLTYENKMWTFEYSNEFAKHNIKPIIDFPDANKTYRSKQLWPFFVSRIPTINQSFQYKKIAKAKINKNDPVGLLKLFGNETITNPFQLLPL